jgi:hypothetical protein
MVSDKCLTSVHDEVCKSFALHLCSPLEIASWVVEEMFGCSDWRSNFGFNVIVKIYSVHFTDV